MTNYRVIFDEEKLIDFRDNFLPELREDEIFYGCLFSRKKYGSDIRIRHDKEQLKRFTTKKDRLVDRLRQLECPVGSYKYDGHSIPQESLVVYITPNPRDLWKATRESLKKLVDLVTREKYNGWNPHQEVMSEIHRARSRTVYTDFDFDNVVWLETEPLVNQFINRDAYRVLRTRGGFHILVEVDKIQEAYKKNWYQGISGLPGCDVRGDTLIPIPGCTQGGFVPYFDKTVIQDVHEKWGYCVDPFDIWGLNDY